RLVTSAGHGSDANVGAPVAGAHCQSNAHREAGRVAASASSLPRLSDRLTFIEGPVCRMPTVRMMAVSTPAMIHFFIANPSLHTAEQRHEWLADGQGFRAALEPQHALAGVVAGHRGDRL